MKAACHIELDYGAVIYEKAYVNLVTDNLE